MSAIRTFGLGEAPPSMKSRPAIGNWRKASPRWREQRGYGSSYRVIEANRVILEYVESYRYCFSEQDSLEQDPEQDSGDSSWRIRCGRRGDGFRWNHHQAPDEGCTDWKPRETTAFFRVEWVRVGMSFGGLSTKNKAIFYARRRRVFYHLRYCFTFLTLVSFCDKVMIILSGTSAGERRPCMIPDRKILVGPLSRCCCFWRYRSSGSGPANRNFWFPSRSISRLLSWTKLPDWRSISYAGPERLQPAFFQLPYEELQTAVKQKR